MGPVQLALTAVLLCGRSCTKFCPHPYCQHSETWHNQSATGWFTQIIPLILSTVLLTEKWSIVIFTAMPSFLTWQYVKVFNFKLLALATCSKSHFSVLVNAYSNHESRATMQLQRSVPPQQATHPLSQEFRGFLPVRLANSVLGCLCSAYTWSEVERIISTRLPRASSGSRTLRLSLTHSSEYS